MDVSIIHIPYGDICYTDKNNCCVKEKNRLKKFCVLGAKWLYVRLTIYMYIHKHINIYINTRLQSIIYCKEWKLSILYCIYDIMNCSGTHMENDITLNCFLLLFFCLFVHNVENILFEKRSFSLRSIICKYVCKEAKCQLILIYIFP